MRKHDKWHAHILKRCPLALNENPDLTISKQRVKELLTDEKFLTSVSGRYQTHKAKTIRARIDYVKDGLKNNAD